MRLLDLQQRQDERELAQMQDDLSRVKITSSGVLAAGHQSEPSTPPEYLDSSSGFPSAFSRPNRYSASSLTSPLGLYSRPIRAGSQLVSPSSGLSMPRYARDEVLARSVPGSRRNSDEEEKEEAVRQDPSSHHAANGYVIVLKFHSYVLSLRSMATITRKGAQSLSPCKKLQSS